MGINWGGQSVSVLGLFIVADRADLGRNTSDVVYRPRVYLPVGSHVPFNLFYVPSPASSKPKVEGTGRNRRERGKGGRQAGRYVPWYGSSFF